MLVQLLIVVDVDVTDAFAVVNPFLTRQLTHDDSAPCATDIWLTRPHTGGSLNSFTRSGSKRLDLQGITIFSFGTKISG